MIQSRSLICLLVAAVSAAAQAPAPLPPQPPQAAQAPQAPQPPPAPFATGAGVGIGRGVGAGPGILRNANIVFGGREDGLYQNGQTALDNRRWEQALDDFSQVVSRGGSRVEGALYWKAYALNKLGRRDEALAAIAELRKSYASSRWLEDAKALEMETKQASGQSVSPESESDEDLKLLALNGLMQSDPDRALPLVENLLKGNQSPKLKKNAVYVIAQNSSPRAQQMLEQVARGSVNPDLQIVAIRYLTQQRRNQVNTVSLLWEIYGSTGDVNVKREIVNGLSTDLLLQVAKTDKASDLRLMAIQRLGNGGGGDALVPLYAAETDPQVRQAIVNTLSSQRNAKALVALARAERDPQVKKSIVQHLVNMKSPDATDYLMEILK
jgi:tetratricopeptide (TPR) repeat protein